jgi:hypothetical protein
LKLKHGVPRVPSRYFEPPTTSNAFLPGQPTQYQWRGGRVTRIHPARLEPYLFGTATVFTQMPDTTHLLAVNLDAGAVNVSDHTIWRNLSFNHISSRNGLGRYSSIRVLGDQAQLAAPGARHWMTQLLPTIYNYQQQVDLRGEVIPPPTSAGLIGDLTLLVALAAFSGPQPQLDQILTHCLRPGRWEPHQLVRDGKLCAFRYHA